LFLIVLFSNLKLQFRIAGEQIGQGSIICKEFYYTDSHRIINVKKIHKNLNGQVFYFPSTILISSSLNP
jgi:hypothetical protein